MQDASMLPKQLLGAAWAPQAERMQAGTYFPLYLVLKRSEKDFSIFFLSSDLQIPEMFVPKTPLGPKPRG
jgi:type II restriction enzyme